LYPRVHERLELEHVAPSGLLYRWRGRSDADPSVLMSHYDVVPADASAWKHPPFCGEVHDGELWGRGALDTKLTLCAVLEAVESGLAEGFEPANDIYLSFAGDEEVIGETAPRIGDRRESRGIRPALVLDEGGAVLSGVFPGIPGPAAMIGVAEKGMMDLELTVHGRGGHASAPPRHTAAGRLARAVIRAERRRMRPRLTRTVRAMLAGFAPHAPFPMRLAVRVLRSAGPVGARILSFGGRQLGAAVRTTVAFTMLEGSPQANVLPSAARAVANIRILQGDTMEKAIARIRRAVRDPGVSFAVLQGNEPSPESPADSDAWRKVRDATARIWPDAPAVPYLMTACTDARHFCRLSQHVFRFSPMEITQEQLATIHNADERVSTAAVAKCIAFYRAVIRSL